MYNVERKNELLSNFIESADESLKVAGMFGNVQEAMNASDAAKVKFLIKKVTDAVAGVVPKGITLAETSLYVNQSEYDGVIKLVDVTIRNKYSSDYKFKFKKQLVLSDDVDAELHDFLKCAYSELITDALINANLEEVNAKLAEISEAAGNTFKVKIVSSIVGAGKKIAGITDDEVVFVADDSRILAMDDILVFCEPTELISEEQIKEGFDAAVSRFAQAQTTAQFVGLHEPLVGYICDISKLVKAITLIKKVYSKNVKKLRSDKDTLAYYLEDGVFSVISVNADGKEVVLQPINTETLEVVDVDVLANI